MNKKEDYLDELLNAVTSGGKKTEEKVKSEEMPATPKKTAGRSLDESELDFLSEYQSELDSFDEKEFLADFEMDLELARKSELDSDPEDDFFAGLNQIMQGETASKTEPEPVGIAAEETPEVGEVYNTSDMMSLLNPEQNGEGEMQTSDAAYEETAALGDENRSAAETDDVDGFESIDGIGNFGDTVNFDEIGGGSESADSGESGNDGDVKETDESEDMNVLDMLNEMSSGDDELSDIANMLQAQDNNEKVSMDMSSLEELGIDLNELIGDTDEAKSEEMPENVTDGVEKDKKGEKGEKSEKSEKKGFLGKLYRLFFGEDDEDSVAVPEQKEMGSLTDENLGILQEIDEAEAEKANAKKLEKQKAKEEKKKAAEEKKAEKKRLAEEKKKAKEAKKASKPAKEKKQKVKEPPLPKLPVFLVVVMAASILLLVKLAGDFVGYKTAIRDAKEAYSRECYVDAYSELAGRTVKEDDKKLYTQIILLASLELEYESYETFMGNERYEQALDSLILGIGAYSRNAEKAEEYGVAKRYESIKIKLEGSLKDTFGLTYEEALELYNIRRRKEYSYEIMQIVAKMPGEN